MLGTPWTDTSVQTDAVQGDTERLSQATSEIASAIAASPKTANPDIGDATREFRSAVEKMIAINRLVANLDAAATPLLGSKVREELQTLERSCRALLAEADRLAARQAAHRGRPLQLAGVSESHAEPAFRPALWPDKALALVSTDVAAQ